MNNSNELARNAFKPIIENPIILDFSGCQYLREIHLILKEKLGLPEYYGNNWDALWDCLDGLFYDRDNFLVEIHGFYSLDKKLRDGCVPMLEVFDDVHKETPNVRFTLVS